MKKYQRDSDPSISPVENFTKLPNDLLEKLALVKLSQYEWRVLLVIIRQTLGWHKDSGDTIAILQFVEKTGIKSGRNIHHALMGLETRRIIVVSRYNRSPSKFCINKTLAQWSNAVNQRTNRQPSPVVRTHNSLPSPDTTDLLCVDTHSKETKEIKERIKESASSPLAFFNEATGRRSEEEKKELKRLSDLRTEVVKKGLIGQDELSRIKTMSLEELEALKWERLHA